MKFLPITLSAALALVTFGSLPGPAFGQVAVATPPAAAWEIGPIIRGRNYSQGMPLQPSPRRGGGFPFDLPLPPASVHALTFRHGSLAGKRRIVMRYRVEVAPGVRIAPPSSPGSNGLITLFFQRGGDNWSGRRQFEGYRWYGTFATQTITPGDHVMVAPLNGNWTAVESSSARTNPGAFADAIEEADRVGFVLGGGDGYGHGVFATGPARIVVTSFRVE